MSEKENHPNIVEEPDLSGTYTASDYLKWNLDELVELIRGKIFKMSPSPTSYHQQISTELFGPFYAYFKDKKCTVFHAPLDVYLVHPGEDYKKTKNVVEPDIFAICTPGKIKKFGIVGTPDLIIEILSPSTSRKDQKDKFELYEEYGVKEYWIVSPENRSVVVNLLENGKYRAFRPVTEKEMLHSKIFPGLEVNLNDVFKDLQE